ncbi:Pentatricopeptide repeat-containing protein [Thalictrum thalictroides]|uniref:Pentatricopeptide repeat-containing protein n=1 Tax=Thalictrum thalictroides TaxID=46969 RepID=A0A7J6VD68_THATH|nr:Pentatricopeptide repeat-containing protein [Thalictrum thalictroides]
MAGYINNGKPRVALRLFETMPKDQVLPNSFTFTTVINACSFLADVETGRKIHAHVEILGLKSDLVICTSLIDMYGKCNDVVEAWKVFDTMVYRNVVSWTSMIVVYVQNALGEQALLLFREFILFMSPNHFMLASVISACASLGRLVTGKVTHGAVIRRGYDGNDVVASSLVDMYAKCGCITYSGKVFRLIESPCVIQYTSMIVGAAKYGQGNLSLDLFQEMIERGIRPNDVTFVGVLHACSHSGLVDIGLEHLNSMYTKHGIVPGAKHYICAVDMLGRLGRLDEAYQLAQTISAEAKEVALLWGSLLSASRSHGRLDLTVEAGKRLLELKQQLAGTYITMSNTYATMGKWEDAHRIRSEMINHGIQKEPGCSWVEIKDLTYAFYAGGLSSCTRRTEILNVLRELELRMKERGYVSGSKGSVFVDVEEEAEEAIVGLHSEKLALGFSLISMPRGTTIRIMKNLRMCWNCHEAFKLISNIVQRDIVVRDLNRFHHFKDGLCTCKDFW